MIENIKIGVNIIEVEFKDIKNIHLSVYPPDGRVRIAAPKRMDLDMIRLYAISKIDWIKKQQKSFRNQKRETPREYINLESHYVWGQRFLMEIIEEEKVPSVELTHKSMILRIRPGTDQKKREAIVSEWYRDQIREKSAPLFEKWENVLKVRPNKIIVRWMKTKWGSFNPESKNILLNTELAKKPEICLEYIILHELIHLIEPRHNGNFVLLMDKYMPHWKHIRNELNHAPLGHVDWEY